LTLSLSSGTRTVACDLCVANRNHRVLQPELARRHCGPRRLAAGPRRGTRPRTWIRFSASTEQPADGVPLAEG
jgi:hypothetical protein